VTIEPMRVTGRALSMASIVARTARQPQPEQPQRFLRQRVIMSQDVRASYRRFDGGGRAPRRLVAARRDAAGRHGARRRTVRRARWIRRVHDRRTTTGTVTLCRGLRAARRRDASERAEGS